MKRKRVNDNDNDYNYPNKRIRLINPSLLRNTIMDNMFMESFGNESVGDFDKFLMKMGDTFENKVYNELKNKYQTINIADFPQSEHEKETLKAINSRIPIIYQGYLVDQLEGLHGHPDLIIRNDILRKIFKDIECIEDNDKYTIIDIKFSNLEFMKNKINLLNTNKTRAYKVQVYIYSKLLAKIQGYFPKYGYILGRGWKRQNTVSGKTVVERSNDCFSKLGVIDFNEQDNFISEYTISIIEKFRNYNIKEQYPNMTITEKCPKLQKMKYDIAEKNGEITLINGCSVVNRNIALSNGIKSFRDKRCNADALGIKGKIKNTVDNIIRVNNMKELIMYPDKISNNLYKWKDISQLELYVDFEIISNVFMEDFKNISEAKVDSIIYLIGVGYYDGNNKWNYKSFTVDNLTEKSERDIIFRFINFINEKSRELNSMYGTTKTNIKLFHWGHVEKSIFKAKKDKYNKRWNIDDNWVDFCNVLKKDSIAIKGCYNYSIKSIGKALYNLGLIRTDWKYEDGVLSTIMGIRRISEKANKENKLISSVEEYSSILDYNEVDCKVLSEIVDFFRKC